ncbi:MAG: hypothetical protein L6W00_04995 [Lentisphaeria bacterium]|nr:MAG: hypothetical protein L6W00_04995 [Lentisphaeria bacterium]
MAQAIRELDPQAKIAGPGCHIKPEFLAAYLKAGAAKVLDALTEHPYRQLPELPDLETAQQEFQATLKRYRPDLPILSSESGNMNFPTLPDNRIHPLAVQYAARDLRYALIEFACGVKSYFHFQSTGIDLGYAWTGVLGDPDHHWVPAPSSMRSGMPPTCWGGSGRRPGPTRGQQTLLHFRQRHGTNRRALAVGGDARNARICPQSRLLRHDGQLIFREKNPAG